MSYSHAVGGQVDWRAAGSNSWEEIENGTGTSAQMTALQAEHVHQLLRRLHCINARQGNAPYELRVEQVCSAALREDAICESPEDTRLNSVTQKDGLFTLPGIFSV